jgi:hypothetical protein
LAAACIMVPRSLPWAAATAAWLGCMSDEDRTELLQPEQPAAPESASAGPAPSGEGFFPTSNVVFSEEGQSTYVSVLSSLARQSPTLDGALELAGWAKDGSVEQRWESRGWQTRLFEIQR